jgi:predicted ABC-type ATPase
MKEKNLYIIAGCNGAGKTTASFTILPEIINCKEFEMLTKLRKVCLLFNPKKLLLDLVE